MIVFSPRVSSPQFVDGVLLQNAIEALVELERVGLFPRGNLLVPIAQIVGGFDDFVQFRQREFDVADNRNVGRFVLVDLRRIDVDVDDEAVLGEFRHFAGHTVVEPHAKGQQQIGLVHGVIRIHAAVHAEHVEREGIGRRIDAPDPSRSWPLEFLFCFTSSRSSALASPLITPPPA